MNTSELQEGKSMKLSKEYQLPRSTVVKMGYTFDTTGKEYNVTLIAVNQHTKLDTSILTWTVICGNPIKPSDWTLDYVGNVRPGTPVSLRLSINPEVDLPTKPVLIVTKVDGHAVTSHSLEMIPNATAIPFGLTFKDNEEVTNCLEKDAVCYDEYTFDEMGIGSLLKSNANGKIGGSYQKKIIATVTFDETDGPGGSFGFAVHFFNKLSNVSHDYELEDVEVQKIYLLDAEPDGSGLWNEIEVPKWQFNWIQSFAKFEGTIQVVFQYTSHGNPLQYDMDLDEGTWYLPGSSVPAFSISFLKGTARRVQYTLNNTDADGYQPPPCIVDWPKPEITLDRTLKYTIKHCDGPVSSTLLVINI